MVLITIQISEANGSFDLNVWANADATVLERQIGNLMESVAAEHAAAIIDAAKKKPKGLQN